jgi:hypothetical protein
MRNRLDERAQRQLMLRRRAAARARARRLLGGYTPPMQRAA